MADPITHQIVGLIEHAEACQKAADEAQQMLVAATSRLATQSTQLDARIAATVERVTRDTMAGTPAAIRDEVQKSLSGALESLQEASRSVDGVIAHLGWKAALVAAIIATSMCAVPLAAWALLVPSSSELSQLRAERDQLKAETARYQALHSISTCGPKKLPCARVDTTGGVFGPGADYYLIKPAD
jgi:hypothetical protein